MKKIPVIISFVIIHRTIIFLMDMGIWNHIQVYFELMGTMKALRNFEKQLKLKTKP